MNPSQLRKYVIIPALEDLEEVLPCASEAAVNLLLGTVAQESAMGKYIHQLGDGPALGIYQCEPATHDDIWKNYILNRNTLNDFFAKRIPRIDKIFRGGEISFSHLLITDLRYATMIARIHYWRKPGALPDANDIEALGAYWKLHYNTEKGRGTVEEFVENYHRHVGV